MEFSARIGFFQRHSTARGGTIHLPASMHFGRERRTAPHADFASERRWDHFGPAHARKKTFNEIHPNGRPFELSSGSGRVRVSAEVGAGYPSPRLTPADGLRPSYAE
jgi:hypothetical protein